MIEKTEEKIYEPYEEGYFNMTKEQLSKIEFLSLWYGYPYQAPFFGFCLKDGHTHPYAENLKKEWEEKHGPMPSITIID